MAPLLAAVIPQIVDIIGGLFNKTVDKVLPPDTMSEEQKEKLQQEFVTTLLNHDWNNTKAEYDDRASARSLAEKDIATSNAWTSALAATVRPAWGFGALGLVGYSVLYGYDISATLESIIQTVLFFYFGGRTLEKVAPMALEVIRQRGSK